MENMLGCRQSKFFLFIWKEMFKKQYKEFSFRWTLFLQITPFFETHPFSTWLKGNGEQYHTVYSYVF